MSRVTPVALHRRPGLDPQRSERRVPEVACVLLPSASRAVRLATRHPVPRSISGSSIPFYPFCNLSVCVHTTFVRRVLCAYHLVTFETPLDVSCPDPDHLLLLTWIIGDTSARSICHGRLSC